MALLGKFLIKWQKLLHIKYIKKSSECGYRVERGSHVQSKNSSTAITVKTIVNMHDLEAITESQ